MSEKLNQCDNGHGKAEYKVSFGNQHYSYNLPFSSSNHLILGSSGHSKPYNQGPISLRAFSPLLTAQEYEPAIRIIKRIIEGIVTSSLT